MTKCRSFALFHRARAVACAVMILCPALHGAAALPFVFAVPVNYPAGLTPSAVVVADFNADQKPDLTGFWTEGAGALISFRGNGDGTFAMPGSNYMSFPARYGAPGDFNNDGRMDLLTVDASIPFARLLLGRGNGAFSNSVSVFLHGTPFSAVAADFNGDGKLDAAVSLPTEISVFLGNGLGGLTSAPDAPTGYNSGITFQTFVAVGDLNGDGTPDLAAVSALTNIVSVLIGNGDGTFRAPVHYLTGDAPNHVAIADLNGDGRLDLVTANAGAGTISVRFGLGNGTFAAGPNVNAGGIPYAVAIADFNGDGHPDLATASRPQGSVGLLAGNGNGTFQAVTNFFAGIEPVFVVAGDFDGDGKPDLATANKYGDDLSVLLNRAVTPLPTLVARPRPANRLQLTWSGFGTALFELQATSDITTPASWTNLNATPVASNGIYSVTLTNNGDARGYFRLRRP